jgi:hypothetical protein
MPSCTVISYSSHHRINKMSTVIKSLQTQEKKIATPRFARFASPCLACTLMALRAMDPRILLLKDTRITGFLSGGWRGGFTF